MQQPVAPQVPSTDCDGPDGPESQTAVRSAAAITKLNRVQ